MQLRSGLDGIGKVHLHSVGQAIGNGLTEGVGHVEGKSLHTGHILDGVLCGHRTVGDDMSAILMSVLVHHPLQHTSAPIVIKVGIDIREVYTVWVEETFKQQVIFQRVYLGNTQAISHY